MHPFQRFTHYTPIHKSPTKCKKDKCIVENPDKHTGKDETEQEQCDQREILRKGSHSKTHIPHNTKNLEILNERSGPVMDATPEGTEIRQRTTFRDILRAKEKALWSNTSTERDNNVQRLGPNKNTIIEESLRYKNT